MIRGVMTTRHIVSHPQIFIESVGIRGYIALLRKCLSRRRYFLINVMMDGRIGCATSKHNAH